MRLIALFLLVASSVSAACHVVGPSSTGGGTGADWNNIVSLSSVTQIVGDTYYLQGGSGGAYTSATSTIPLTITAANTTWNAATVADHCTATGFVNATMAVDGGAGQVILACTGCNGQIWIRAAGVTVNGNAGLGDTSSSWNNPIHACGGTQCGIKLDNSTVNAYETAHGFIWNITLEAAHNNTLIKSVEIVGCGQSCSNSGITNDMFHTDISGTHQQNITITHCYWHNSSQGFVATYGTTNNTVTYNYFLFNGNSQSPPVHGYVWSIQGGTTLTFAYNAVQDTQGTSLIDEINSTCCNTTTGLLMYGNVVWTANNNPNGSTGYGNGVVSCTNGDTCSNWLIYNNDIINMNASGGINNSVSFGGGTAGAGSSITEYNNLFWNSTPALNGNACGGNASCTTDYDYYCNTTHTAQTHEQTDTAPACQNTPIFVDWTGNNFHLATDTNAWTPLGAPYNVDPDGVTRTTSRGAFQKSGVVAPGATILGPVKIVGSVAVQ